MTDIPLPETPAVTKEAIQEWMDIYRTEEKRTKPRFDPTFNLGHVLTILAMVGALWGVTAQMSTKLSDLERGIIAAEERAKKYVPLVEKAEAVNNLQNDRIEGLVGSVQELRRSHSDTTAVLGNMRETLARVETRLLNQSRP